MTELEWLKQESGLTDDELKTYETILGDGKFKAMLKKVITANDTLAAAKKTAETELEQFTTRYNSEFVPAMRDVTQQAITREGEVAALKAKLAKAKEFGLAIDDEPAKKDAVEPPRAPGSPDPNMLTKDDLNRFSSAQSNTILALQDLNAEHFSLFGAPLGNTQELVAETERQRLLGNKNFTLKTAWEVKNNVAAKRAEIQAAQQKKHDDEIREATKREMVERQGSNPYTRSAQTSRYDRYKASDAGQDGTKPWQAARGARERNTNWREAALAKVRSGSAAA